MNNSDTTNNDQISAMESGLFRFFYNEKLEVDLAAAIDEFTTAHAMQNEGVITNWSLFHNSCKFFLHHITASNNKNENAPIDIRKKESMWNVIFSDTIMDYYDDYEVLIGFLKTYNLAIIDKDDKGFNHFVLPSLYRGTVYRQLDEKELKRYNSITSKSKKRAGRILPTSGLSFEYNGHKIDSEFVEYALRNNLNSKGKEYGEEEIGKATKIIEKLNSGKEMWAKVGRRGRLNSDITCLGAVLTDLLVIDGQKTVTLDQHATYLWLIPSVIDKATSDEFMVDALKNELNEYRALLNRISKSKGNLYSHFATCWNLDVGTVKANMINWICDPNVNEFVGVRKQIDEEFTKMFPALRAAMKTISTNSNSMSTRLMHHEGLFFNKLCREVNTKTVTVETKKGTKEKKAIVPRAVTKFDSIIVQESFKDRVLNKAETIFREMFGYLPFLKLKNANGKYLDSFVETAKAYASDKPRILDFSIKQLEYKPLVSSKKSKITTLQNESKTEQRYASLVIFEKNESLDDTKSSLDDTKSSLDDTKIKNESEQLSCEVLPSVTKSRNVKSYIRFNKQGLYVVTIKEKPYRSKTIEGLYEKLRAAGINEQFEEKKEE